MPNRLMGCPNTIPHILNACTFHAAKIIGVKDPTGSGRVQVECPGMWGKGKSNWIQVAGNHVGSDNKATKHSWHWNPGQPGQYGYIFFPGGNLAKPCFMAGNVTMNDKGNPGP